MPFIAMTGNDSMTLNNRILNDFADADTTVLEFPNDIADCKTGKNGNTIYSINQTGQNAELTLRMVRGSPDDIFLNGLLANQTKNFAAFPLMFGEFTKVIGDGLGATKQDIYILSGGIFKKAPGGKSNSEGDVDQSTVTYLLKFGKAPRAIT